MRFVFLKNIYGWNMTGFIGHQAKWFLGFSYTPKKKSNEPTQRLYNHNL